MISSLMIPYLSIFVGGYVLSLILSIFSLCFIAKPFRRAHNGEKYSLLRHFPFEAYENKDKTTQMAHFLSVFGIVLSFLCSLLPLTLTAFPDFSFLLPLSILIAVLSLVEHGSFIALTYIPAYDFKHHLTLVIVYSGASVLSLVITGLSFMNLGKAYSELNVVGMVLLCLFLLAALGVMLGLFTPKMDSWTKMESTMNEDGSTYTTRPKIFLLAFSEWGIAIISELFIGIAIFGYIFFGNAMIS
ncbi:MAG: hypothetical protein SPG64_01335 [Candidatus Enteromonas sp.]|nr:hypothetical protein [Candidatus Enteromonas sp.]